VCTEKRSSTAETVVGLVYASIIKGNRAAGIAVAPDSVSMTNISHVARNVAERAFASTARRNRDALNVVVPACVSTVKGSHDAKNVTVLIYVHIIRGKISARFAELQSSLRWKRTHYLRSLLIRTDPK
jgi:hypothetical protein